MEVRRMDSIEASKMLTDSYSAKILAATMYHPRSAQEISVRYGIPIAACYRRIKQLEDSGLLECTERRLNQKGKRVSLYISRLKNAYIFFEAGKIRVKMQLTTGATREFSGWDENEILRK